MQNIVTRARTDHVLVAGAGMTGLATALALDNSGMCTTILEQGDQGSKRLGSMVLSSADLDVLDDIGVTGEVLTESHPYARRVVNIGRTDLPDRFLRREAGGARIIPLPVLSSLLEHEVYRRGIPILTGHRVKGVLQSPTGVHVDLAGGDRAEGRFLIGADGASSTVRGGIDAHAQEISGEAWTVTGIAWRDDLPAQLSTLLTDDTAVVATVGPVGFVAHVDDPTDTDSIAWSARLATPGGAPHDHSDRRVLLRRVRDLLDGFAPRAGTILRRSDLVTVNPLSRVTPLRTDQLGRIALVGGARRTRLPQRVMARGTELTGAVNLVNALDLRSPASGQPRPRAGPLPMA